MVSRRLDQNPEAVNEQIMGMMIENLNDALAAYSNSNAALLAVLEEDAEEALATSRGQIMPTNRSIVCMSTKKCLML